MSVKANIYDIEKQLVANWFKKEMRVAQELADVMKSNLAHLAVLGDKVSESFPKELPNSTDTISAELAHLKNFLGRIIEEARGNGELLRKSLASLLNNADLIQLLAGHSPSSIGEERTCLDICRRYQAGITEYDEFLAKQSQEQ